MKDIKTEKADQISWLWILAGVSFLGLSLVSWRLNNTDSKHKDLGIIFQCILLLGLLIALFLVGFGAALTAYAPTLIIGYMFISMLITGHWFIKFKETDKPLSDISIRIFIGFLITFAVYFLIAVYNLYRFI